MNMLPEAPQSKISNVVAVKKQRKETSQNNQFNANPPATTVILRSSHAFLPDGKMMENPQYIALIGNQTWRYELKRAQ